MMTFPFSWCDYSTNSICLLFLDGYGEKGKRPTLSLKLKSSKGEKNGGSEEINRREGKKNRTPGEGGKGSCLFVCFLSFFVQRRRSRKRGMVSEMMNAVNKGTKVNVWCFLTKNDVKVFYLKKIMGGNRVGGWGQRKCHCISLLLLS
jgi:hypothetical protein